ncbi:DUF4013 domain-containing protein [Methanobrevibacter sp.]|uniref:DUF4013 domain-containing protein n=1 Tax=Methanobrevibacter sp. TaxID=66852 RepID=UPI00388D1AF5
MEFGEIFSNALKYPVSDYQKLLMVGLVFIVASLPAVLALFGFYNSTFSTIWSIVSLIISILFLGYGLSVIRQSIDLNDEIPAFDWANNLVDGIKSFVVSFVYYLVPAIIVSIISIISLGSAFSTLPKSAIDAMGNATTTNAFINAIPPQTWAALGYGLAVVAIVAIILFIIFGLFQTVATCRLAKYGSLGEAFAFGEVYGDIKKIGILKLLGFLIVLAIIASVIGAVIGLLALIPFIGIIIGYLIGNSFILLFANRAIGLLYSDVE